MGKRKGEGAAAIKTAFNHRTMSKKHTLYGIAGGFGLLLLYFLVLGILNSPGHAVETFAQDWPWLAALSAGFGAQVGLYSYMRSAAILKAAETASVTATGGVSATTMVACCLHHVSDALPVLGLSAAAVFAAKYQTEFIMAGVFSNVIGLNLLLLSMKKHNLYDSNGMILHRVMKLNLSMSLAIVAIAGTSAILLKVGGII